MSAFEHDLEERIRQFTVVARCGIKNQKGKVGGARIKGGGLLGIAQNDFGLTTAEYFRAYARAVNDLDKISRLDAMRKEPIVT